MSEKDIFSNNNKLFIIKVIYFIMFVFYMIISVLLFFTNGSIQYLIQQNIWYILLPVSLPLVLSLVGLNNFKIESGLISVLKAIDNKIHFALGEFVDNSIQSFIENKKELEKWTFLKISIYIIRNKS